VYEFKEEPMTLISFCKIAVLSLCCVMARPKKLEYVPKAKVTYYAPRYNGRMTASGECYSDTLMTCATSNRKYLGKIIKLFGKDTSIFVRCNDMMALTNTLRFDLTRRAFSLLNHNSIQCGVMDLSFLVFNKHPEYVETDTCVDALQ